ncbi:MAG: dolichyl-phosphate beta-glucosyltransferase [Patescibacteria group bacterium]
MFLSVIIPAFNEEKRLKQTLCQISSYLIKGYKDSEIIIVDDGSNDCTFLVANDFSKNTNLPVKVLKNIINLGKGASVKNGILVSCGDFVLFSDADLSTPIEELDKLFNYIKDGYDIIIGSRSKEDSSVQIHQPWYRKKMGKIFNFLVKLLLLKDFNDTQCGFKLFKGDIARKIAGLMHINGFCFDVEMLYIAQKNGYKIKEIGVIWKNSSQSRVEILNSSLRMFFDLLKIKRLHI